MSKFKFTISVKESSCNARAGVLDTPHGAIHTPIFMPIGTIGAVKTISPRELNDLGAEIILGNTYHLFHQPGIKVLKHFGGIAKFNGWNRPMLTDSGGFQVFSLADTRKVREDGVSFRSIYDGSMVNFTPSFVYELQRDIGADFIVALDECPPYPSSHQDVLSAVNTTTKWAKMFMDAYGQSDVKSHQAVFLIAQGGVFEDLRRKSCEELAELDSFGFGIGGLSVGEPNQEMYQSADVCCQILPESKPRHLMGVGTPIDLLNSIEVGVDMFDCVLPTRNARNAQAFVSKGVVNIRNAKYRLSNDKLDEKCACYCCETFTVGYLHHLFNINEILGMRLLTLHNLHYYLDLVKSARNAILANNYLKWKQETISNMILT